MLVFRVIIVEGEEKMAVSKFYARWKKSDGNDEIINVFKAIELKRKGIIVTTPKEVASLYDIETGLKVLPRHGKKVNGEYIHQPSFSYYPSEKNNLSEQGENVVYTPELNVFLEAFKNIKKFQVGFGNNTIVIYPKKMLQFQQIKIDDKSFILQYLVEIDETLPYSAYYRLNGKLALGFYVKSYPESIKKIRLAQAGIPFFEAKACFPKNTKIPREFKSQNEISKVADSVRETYQDRNYKLYGDFDTYHLNELVFLDDNERKYKILKNYEDKCKELESKIAQLKMESETEVQKKNQLTIEVQNLKEVLRKYHAEENYYRELDQNKVKSDLDIKSLEQEKQKLLEENKDLKSKLNDAREENMNLKNRPFWQRLFNKAK